MVSRFGFLGLKCVAVSKGAAAPPKKIHHTSMETELIIKLLCVFVFCWAMYDNDKEQDNSPS